LIADLKGQIEANRALSSAINLAVLSIRSTPPGLS
jgi:hypothetical protein